MCMTKHRENQNMHFMFCNFFSKSGAVIEVMWKYMVELDRCQMTIWRMRIACWVHRATNTHSQYVIIIAFPLQQLLHECPSMLRYTCISCIVVYS